LAKGNKIGDANTVTTKDLHWFGYVFGTNVLNVNGFMHMYAPLGQGLIIQADEVETAVSLGMFCRFHTRCL